MRRDMFRNFFLIQKFFISKYALRHTIQLLNAQFSVTNSTYKHTLLILLTTINCLVTLKHSKPLSEEKKEITLQFAH